MRDLPGVVTLVYIAFFIFTIGWAGTRPQLIVRDFKSQEILVRIPVEYGQTFIIRYIHSVDLSPVFEVFQVNKKDGLVLEETYFRMFGAGMGHWEGHGKLVLEGKWTKIKDIHYRLGSFLLRVGSLGVDHTILLNGKEWNLSRIAAGCLVEITVSEE